MESSRSWRTVAMLVILLDLLAACQLSNAATEPGTGPGASGGAGVGMFRSVTEEWLEDVDSNQRNYGVAITDVDHDGEFDIVVAGFTGPNLVLRYNKVGKVLENLAEKNSPFEALRDEKGQAIGVAACDIDGDGKEEIYFLNTNRAYAGVSLYEDKLFKWRDGRYVDLYADPVNSNVTTKHFAGRSVACLDRHGTGKYGFVVATYSQRGTGHFSLITMDEYHRANDVDRGNIVLQDVAKEAGLDRSTGGRGIAVGPILNDDGRSEIFFVNEGNSFLENRGENYLMKNLGNGTFIDVARQHGIADEHEAGRGVALGDFNCDGLLDVVYGNYDGPSRLFMQSVGQDGKKEFLNVATPELDEKSTVRNVLAADFDNDGDLDIYFNNMREPVKPEANKLFRVTSYGSKHAPGITKMDPGDATEEDGYGTGSAYVDIDNDGRLELVTSHGEGVAQPVEVYKVNWGLKNHWLRVVAFTKYGGPARGAKVQIFTKGGEQQTRVLDGGSGYLCQMEPVAHFGLGSDDLDRVAKIKVTFPDTKVFVWIPKEYDIDTTLAIYHPDFRIYQAAQKASNMTVSAPIVHSHNHTEL